MHSHDRICPHCDGTGRVFIEDPEGQMGPYRCFEPPPPGELFPTPPHMATCGVCGGDGLLDRGEGQRPDLRDPYQSWVAENQLHEFG